MWRKYIRRLILLVYDGVPDNELDHAVQPEPLTKTRMIVMIGEWFEREKYKINQGTMKVLSASHEIPPYSFWNPFS